MMGHWAALHLFLGLFNLFYPHPHPQGIIYAVQLEKVAKYRYKQNLPNIITNIDTNQLTNWKKIIVSQQTLGGLCVIFFEIKIFVLQIESFFQ